MVILDIGLPSISGFEVASRLRALPTLEGVRLIALTGHDLPNHASTRGVLDFDYHLVRALGLESLNRLLEQVSAGREQCVALRRA